jgi:hypothetical protein
MSQSGNTADPARVNIRRCLQKSHEPTISDVYGKSGLPERADSGVTSLYFG